MILSMKAPYMGSCAASTEALFYQYFQITNLESVIEVSWMPANFDPHLLRSIVANFHRRFTAG